LPIDMARASVGFADVLNWSPGGDALAIYASGPSGVVIWVVVPGTDAPAAIAGSALPDGANYVTNIWWL
jgi:hypothetical protein